MGRESWRYAQHERERAKRKRMNPVWRGVGCVLAVILALLGYAFADWFLRANAVNAWIYLPAEVITPSFASGLPPGMVAKLVVAFLFMILSYALMSTFYAILFPIQLGETDMPPLRRVRRRR
jgi:hypothetical protein